MHVRNQEKVIILSYSWLKEAVLEEAGKGRGEEKEEDKNTTKNGLGRPSLNSGHDYSRESERGNIYPRVYHLNN